MFETFRVADELFESFEDPVGFNQKIVEINDQADHWVIAVIGSYLRLDRSIL